MRCDHREPDELLNLKRENRGGEGKGGMTFNNKVSMCDVMGVLHLRHIRGLES